MERKQALKAILEKLTDAGTKMLEIVALSHEEAVAMEETLQREGLRNAGQHKDGAITVKQFTRGECIVNLHCHCAN